jgi:hypothetical protein
VTTLQKVAVISSMQITPVVGACGPVDWPARPADCWPFDVATCAATGDNARSSVKNDANATVSINGRFSHAPLAVRLRSGDAPHTLIDFLFAD